MALKTGQARVDDRGYPWPLTGPPCRCLAAFFREEFARHRRCLEQQREDFSDCAIEQVEDVLARVMEQIDQLCQRDDAGEVVGQLLRQLDVVTNLSATTELRQLH
jgi:hypothetical protein